MDISISSEANVPTPPAGYVTLFINTDKGNILYGKYPDGTFRPYAGDSDAGDIAKLWTDRVTCSLSSGMITASDFEAIMGQGFTVTSVISTDSSGNPTVTVSVGSRSGS